MTAGDLKTKSSQLSVAELQLQGAKRRKRKAVNGQPATATQRPEGRIARLCGKKESM